MYTNCMLADQNLRKKLLFYHMWQHEDFLRYYKIPDIKNYTNVSTIKFILIRFMLLQSEFKFQT